MKFATQARVTVPGTVAQAVICDATETVPGFPIYTLRWLDEAGETHTGTCGEGDLAKANPSDAEIAAADAHEQEAAEIIRLGIVQGVRRELDRHARAARKAKSAKPKRKR